MATTQLKENTSIGISIRMMIVSYIISFSFHCKMPALNSPGDPLSEDYGRNLVLSELVRYWLRDKVAPDSLLVLGAKSIAPYESGFRIYRIGEDGPTGEIDYSGIQAANFSAFPGCQPIRMTIPPRSREIITFTGSSSNRIAVHRYTNDHKLSLLEDQAGIGIPSHMAITTDGTTAYVSNGASNPNSINRYSRNPFTGSLSVNNGSNYPFSVGCSPVSLRTSTRDNLVITATTSYNPLGVEVYKNFGTDSGAFASGSPYDPGTNPSSHNNLCLIESERLLYMTAGDANFPIYGFRYDENGTMTVLPNSPFAPDSGTHGPASVDNYSTSMTLDPNGKYLAYMYAISGTFYLRLLTIDVTTGNITPTDQKYSVGNAPKHLEWDGSGKFLYLVSDTGGSTNNFQLEYFKFSNDGTLSKGPNIIIAPMGGSFSVSHMKSLPIYY
ncbi:beta-propeller fold lactonase family protein [Leptospira biflexa]|uniref:beta-propeller fold lactonase family protein n=1 Tax=Leptospira biflexa TaxID=172 RepID=UPI0010829A90|nr:beta-propeller fold lactonase family protein [Leptospira biflexa]TGM33638.1 hypothetical protein EHQ89_14750 [Leptospira biflexa]TGM34464.1 hypothetical protein EHQ80_14180 [Leptospira biflexa]